MKVEKRFQDNKIDKLKAKIIEIFNRKGLPDNYQYIQLLKKTNAALDAEKVWIRPRDHRGRPGGIIYLKPGIPTIIVPDLHARVDFLVSILTYTDASGYSVLQKISFDQLQIICVGDGFHSEVNTADRWKAANLEFINGFKKHRNMDKEMKSCLELMEIVQLLKISFPENFHFLKGNHENICNENKEGNYPFRKYAFESMMSHTYIKKNYSKKFLDLYYSFEKNMPLFAVGNNFCVSHAEPESFYDLNSLIEYRNRPEVIKGLTWTSDGESKSGSVKKMLECYLSKNPEGSCYYFGGHRAIKDRNLLYKIRANGRYIQIHNPYKFIIAFLPGNGIIKPKKHIMELENKLK